MRRLFLALLCVLFLCPCAASAEGEKYVALTFDDGPSGRFTRELLDGLRARDARATFFLCGYRMETYPEETQRILREGHEIGFHGYSHETMKSMSRRQIAQEIADSRALLPQDCEILWLRPPGGCCSDAVRQVTEVTGLSILEWSVDPKDWATTDAAAVVRRVVDTVKDGDVILLHDMTDSSVAAALEIVDRLGKQGYRFVTVTELARLRMAYPRPGKTYHSFPPREGELK